MHAWDNQPPVMPGLANMLNRAIGERASFARGSQSTECVDKYKQEEADRGRSRRRKRQMEEEADGGRGRQRKKQTEEEAGGGRDSRRQRQTDG